MTTPVIKCATNEKLRLHGGYILQSQWRVKHLLGEGQYGAVYEVLDLYSGKHHAYALKIELKKDPADRSPRLLPLEVAVLRELRQIKASHCPGYQMCGVTEQFNFVVMGLVGRTLDKLRNSMPEKRFTIHTVVHVGVHSLLGIAEIHTAGYLHRDIKPENMCVGRAPDDLRSIYVLDWGLCRKYLDEKGCLFKRRLSAGFRGTPWYCSMNALFHGDQGRIDDLWSWFFCLIEFTIGKLPWEDITEAPSDSNNDYLAWMGRKKKEIVSVVDRLCHNCPREYYDIYEMLSIMNFDSQPNYGKIIDLLTNVLTRKKVDKNQPLDWEPNTAYGHYTQQLPNCNMVTVVRQGDSITRS